MIFERHKKMFIILCILTLILIFCIGNIIYCSTVFSYNNYEIETSKIKNSVRIVAISDTEGNSFGENDIRLIEKIEEANPEIVMILGDMVDRYDGNYDNVLNLCSALSEKYPVYYTLGNHECLDFEGYENYLMTLETEIEKTGAVLLRNEMTEYTTKNGDRITIAGLKTYPFFDYDAPDYDNPENHLFQKYLRQEDDEHFSILMCHQPETYSWSFKNYDIDLMMCGHTHGGVVRLPFIGGLYAPELGWFPEYDKGYYTNGNASMLISSGLDGAGAVPRFNNPLDITVLDLKPAK